MDDVTASIIIACQTAGAVNSINKLGFAMGMLGRKAIDFMSQSLQSFNAAQDASWKFGKTFRNSMGSATQAVKEFMEEYNLSEQTAKKMLTDTASILKGFGFSEKDALKISEQVSRMGIDLASFTGEAGGAQEAVDSITSALTGETERMKKYGTVIRMDDKALVSLSKTIQKNKNVSETQARSLAILREIVKQNADAIGDYKAEGENWTQAQNDQKEAIIDLKDNLGGLLYEILDVYENTNKFTELIKKITKTIKENSDEWSYSVASFINIMRGGFDLIWMVVKNAFSNVAVVGEYVWESLVQAWADAPGFFGAVWEDIKNIADNTWNALDVFFRTSFEFYGDVLHSFLNNWESIFSDLREITKRTVKSIGAYFVTAIKNIGLMASAMGKNFWDLLTGKKKFSEAVGGIFDSYMTAWENIGEAIEKQWKGFEFGAGIKQFGEDVASAFVKGTEKRIEAGAKIIGEAGRNTSAYLAKNGIRMGEFTSVTAGIDEVIDAYNKRQRKIDARKGQQSPEQGGGGNNGNKNLVNFSLSMKSIAEQVSKFRSSSQSAVLANSVDALRLQSRVLTQSPEMKVQQSQLDTLKQIKNGIDRLIGPSRTAQTLVRS